MGVLGNLRKVAFLKPFIAARDSLMKRMGLFKVKSSVKRRFSYIKWRFEDSRKRREIAKHISQLPDSLLFREHTFSPTLTVSLTSYGKRVENSSPYAIYSILKQTVLPDRIVLNLGKKTWDGDNLPTLLKKLERVGVTVQFVDDIGPHTKLLPTLSRYPDDVIITVDDDVYYEPDTIEELLNAYQQSDGKTVICRAGKCLIQDNGCFGLYSEQPDLSVYSDSPFKLPFGFAGVLYPPHIFSDEVFNIELIKRLCPKADDIWFGVTELREGIRVDYLENSSWKENSVDRNEEFNPSVSSALYIKNDLDGQNDVQWTALMDHYFGEGV